MLFFASISEFLNVAVDQGEPVSFAMYSEPVKKRIGALRKIDQELQTLHKQFLQEVADLKKAYEPLFNESFTFREAIISGKQEPRDDNLTPQQQIYLDDSEDADSDADSTVGLAQLRFC